MGLSTHLAFDLGATSGRAILGILNGDQLTLNEVHRFPTTMTKENGRFFWDAPRLFNEITAGLTAARTASPGAPISSIGVDTWGVDFGLLDADGRLCAQPVAYRDPYTDGMMEKVFERIPRASLYARTGIQFLQINSIFQLFALKRMQPELLERASALLFMPDLIVQYLTGCMANEYTIASTSQLLDASKRDWDRELIATLGFPDRLFRNIIHPSSDIGPLHASAASAAGFNARVLAVASHDTASAVAAVPAESPNFAYISSGTWSLMGIETMQPLISEETLRRNFTNEGGAGNTYRVLKNITGMWLLEECRRIWKSTGGDSYGQLIDAAMREPAFRSFIDPDDAAFARPDDMPEAICRRISETHQPALATPGAVTRAIFESLALKYRAVLDELRAIAPHPIDAIHVIGGGSRNALLCQWTADACGVPVVAGPAEATAIGNIMMQARALGSFETLASMRRTIRNSFAPVTYTPNDTARWNEAYERFRNLTTQH
ncbi:MAG: rhamnulokinase [Acidobacteriota bacterium]